MPRKATLKALIHHAFNGSHRAIEILSKYGILIIIAQ
jgi:hypothetical protein